MQINLFLLLFVIILGLLAGLNDTSKSRSFYIITCSIVLIFIASMRSPEWMTYMYHKDTMQYKYFFESSFDLDWHNLWSQIYMRYFENEGDGDLGFILLNKLLSFITHDFHIYSVIVDLIFFVPFGLILYRYSSNIFHLIFAFVFYIALVQTFLLAGARQIYALGFDMISLLFVIEKKHKLAVLSFILGVSIHFSSLLFIFPLLMLWNDVSPQILKRLHLLCFLLFPFVLLFPSEMIVAMGNAVGMEKYADYGKGNDQGGAVTFVLLIELLSFICLIGIKKKDMVSNIKVRFFYVMSPLLTLTAPLIRANGAMIRVSLYFHIFLVLLVPYALDCLLKMKHERALAYVLSIGLLSFLTLSGGDLTYYFYWQV